MKRKLRYGRDKMLGGGSSSAAILTAAGITSAASLAAAGIGANAAKTAAKQQADATINAARRQADAIKDQTARAREYQLDSQSFIKDENAENRALQQNIQLQLQALTGQQNVNDRLDASRIAVKAGGRTRKLGRPTFLLRGGNMPFQVTDGGGVIPVGTTPEGFDLYELYGNDHEHYHKTRGGKYKSGVGIKFADGNVVEGEGDQKKRSGGELMLVTPDNAYFISKHNINGFNPAEAVDYGLHPLQAYAIQEQQKNAIGMNDDGSKAKYGKKFLIGGTPNDYDYINMNYPQVGTDTVGDTTVGVVYATQNPTEKRRLRNGGTIRRKAARGTAIYSWWNNLTPAQRAEIAAGTAPRANVTVSRNASGTNSSTINSITSPQSFEHAPYVRTGSNSTRGNSNTTGFGNWVNNNADLLGAGINALGNIGGAWITSSANRSAARALADAYNQGANIMADAYRNMRTIDMNSLRREDYRAAHMMPALQAPVSFADNQVATVNRSLQRRLRNAGRYSMSSAAAQDRMTDAEIEGQDSRNKIYSTDQQQKQDIRQKSAERVSEASRVNAALDAQANEQYAQDYLRLLQYNNDIENQRILGSAGALSEGAINGASAISQGRTSSAQAWANALANSGLTFGNTLSSMAKRRADIENTMLGSTLGGRVNYLSRYGNKRDKDRQKVAIQRAINSGGLSADDKAMYEYYLELLS